MLTLKKILAPTDFSVITVPQLDTRYRLPKRLALKSLCFTLFQRKS